MMETLKSLLFYGKFLSIFFVLFFIFLYTTLQIQLYITALHIDTYYLITDTAKKNLYEKLKKNVRVQSLEYC